MSKKLTPNVRFKGFSDDWEQRKLGDIVPITMGQSPSSKNYTDNPNDYILVQGNADMKNGEVFPRVWTTQVTKKAQKGDLILSVRAPVGDIGKTEYNVVLGRGVAAIKGNNFIFQQLGKMKKDGFWFRYSTGSTFESINSNDIKQALILVPDEKEQVQVGSFLSQLDSTIASNQKQLDQLKTLKKLFLQKIFDQEWRFKGFTDPWEQRKLNIITSKIGSGKTPRGGQKNYTNNGILFLRSQNIHNNLVDIKHDPTFISEKVDEEMSGTRVKFGDVLLNITGASIGRSAVYKHNFPANVNQHVSIIRAEEGYSPAFIQNVLSSDMGQKQINQSQAGGGREGLNFHQIGNFKFKFPDILEQDKITSMLEELENIIASNQKQLDQLKQLKKWFLQNLFV